MIQAVATSLRFLLLYVVSSVLGKSAAQRQLRFCFVAVLC